MEAGVTNQKGVSRIHKIGLCFAQNTKLPNEPISIFALRSMIQQLANIPRRFVPQNEPIFNRCVATALNHSLKVSSQGKSHPIAPSRA